MSAALQDEQTSSHLPIAELAKADALKDITLAVFCVITSAHDFDFEKNTFMHQAIVSIVWPRAISRNTRLL